MRSACHTSAPSLGCRGRAYNTSEPRAPMGNERTASVAGWRIERERSEAENGNRTEEFREMPLLERWCAD